MSTTPIYTHPHRYVADGSNGELLVGAYLKYEMGETWGGVYTDIKDLEDFSSPVTRVNRAPGGRSGPLKLILENQIIDIDVYGQNRAVVDACVKRARALMYAIVGVLVDGAVVTAFEELDAPSDRYENRPDLFRVGFTHQVSIHPAN